MTEPNRLDEVVGGKYRIVRFLAAGGMGSVYEAQHTVVRRRFAVKFLHHELSLRRELLARFQLEAESAGALESEHVAAAVDFGIAGDGTPYIVLEYLVGESLEHLLGREGRLPLERATNLVQQACRGVQAAHAAGIVHRDLKPHNLFLCRREDGTDLVKVLDFGVAKLEVAGKSSAATRTGTVLGTPSYMSPEQARGERGVEHASDVYALGAILFELLSGKKPHPGESHNAILHHIATQPPLPLRTLQPGLPEALVLVVEQALASEPAVRQDTAEALAEALTPWSRAEVWPAPKLAASAPRHPEPSATLPAVDVPRAPDASPPVAVSSPLTPPTRWPLALGAIALGTLALVLLLGRSNRPEPPPAQPERALVAVAPLPKPEMVTVVSSPAPPPAALPTAAAPEARPPLARAEAAPRPSPPPVAAVHPSGRPGGRPASAGKPADAAKPSGPADEPSHSGPVTFDQKNPYQ